MKYTYTFVSGGYWGESSYYAYENSGQLNPSKVPDRYPPQFIVWWTGDDDFDHKGHKFETDENINMAFNRWITEVVKPLLPDDASDDYEVLDNMVRDYYDRCAAGVNNSGQLAQLNHLMTHGVSPFTILQEFGVKDVDPDTLRRGDASSNQVQQKGCKDLHEQLDPGHAAEDGGTGAPA